MVDLTERNEEVKRLWKLGHSIDAIGKIMDLTRNTVAGVCSRAGLRRADKRTVNVGRLKEEGKMKEEKPPKEGGVEIEDLKDHHCRWIVGKGELDLATYCGKTKLKWSSYCLEHYERAHVSHARG